MSFWRQITSGLRVLRDRKGADRDIADEVDHYLREAEAASVAKGLSQEEARRAARLELGGVTAVREQVRGYGWENAIDSLLADLRYAARLLIRNPGFALVAVITLALGIGINTTLFSAVDSLLLKPLPYPAPDRLVALFEADAKDVSNRNPDASAPNFFDWRRMNRSFEEVALFDLAEYDLVSAGQAAERIPGARVSAGFFRVLGVQPALGRGFLPEEEQPGRDREVVIDFDLWTHRFNADPGLVGRMVTVNGEARTVVGVMPSSFRFQFWTRPQHLWLPAGYTAGDRQRGNHSFLVIARLQSSVTLAAARADMDRIGRQLAIDYPAENAGRTVAVDALTEVGTGELRSMLMSLSAAFGFVLLIACVNVANLLLARAAGRDREFSLRCALGAGLGRVIRQLVTESLLLALLGGGGGVLLALACGGSLIRILPAGFRFLPMRPLDAIATDGRVLSFAFGVSCLCGCLFSLAPALAAFRSGLGEGLKRGGRSGTNGRATRLRYGLVTSEVALTMVVLTCAGLMIASMVSLLRVKPGFDPDRVLTINVASPQTDLYNGPPLRPRFCLDLSEQVGALPGVESVSGVAQLPLRGGAARNFVVEGREYPEGKRAPGSSYDVACPGYFRTLRIPVLQGREFSAQDTLQSTPVAMINQTMAQRFWPNESPIGKRIRVLPIHSNTPWLTVVGVYGDVHKRGLDREPGPEFFRPYTQAAWPQMTVVVRTAATPFSLAPEVQKALAKLDPDHAGSEPELMAEVVQMSVGDRRFYMLIFGCLAALALVLSAVGIAGVIGYSVAHRKSEIGIRIALGASNVDVLGLIVGQGLRWSLAGVLLGLLGSVAVSRLLAGMLFGVRPADPPILAAVALLLMSVAALASWLPARRAASSDPMAAIRYE